MSKSITIQEGGNAKAMNNVKKLQTSMSGGGICYWVPEDDVKTGTKRINQNGTYKASDDDLYGYSEVVVTGIGQVKGKKDDGNDYVVYTDTSSGGGSGGGDDGSVENGMLIEKMVPSEIEIIENPTKLIYEVGDTVDITGISVQLLDGNGNVFTDDRYTTGIIPFDELSVSTEPLSNSTRARKVPVQWIDPYSGDVLIDDFDITVSGSSSDTGYGWSCDPQYLVYDANTNLGYNNYREYRKAHNGYAIGLWVVRNSDNALPYLISSDSNAARLNTPWLYTYVDSGGHTWYVGTGAGERGAGWNTGRLPVHYESDGLDIDSMLAAANVVISDMDSSSNSGQDTGDNSDSGDDSGGGGGHSF